MEISVNKFPDRFKEGDYSAWKTRLCVFLDSEDLLGVIQNPIPKKPDDEWLKKNKKAYNQIMSHIDDKLLGFIKGKETAKEAFARLDEAFEVSDALKQMSFKKHLFGLELGKDESITTYFARFESLISELEAAGGEMPEQDKITCILKGLPDDYDTVVEVIYSSEQIPTLGAIKGRILARENKLKSKRLDTTTEKILMASTSDPEKSEDENKQNTFQYRGKGNYRGRGNYRGKFNFRGSYRGGGQYHSKAGRGGHTYGGRGSHNNNNNSNKWVKCFYCGKPGHKRDDCRYRIQEDKKKQKKSPEALFASIPNTGQEKMVSSYWCAMAGNNKTTNFGGIDFIVDSGANVHIIKDDNYFQDYIDLPNPVPIQIAKNETFIYAYKRGNVEVTSSFGIPGTLVDVLYCPEAPYNLLSVDRMHDAGLEVYFKADRTIQFIKNGKVVMTCNRQNNSQTLKLQIRSSKILVANLCNSNTNYNLWHKRLGHLSKDKFLELKRKGMVYDVSLIQKINPDDHKCESCIYGKQTRLSSKNTKDKTYINRPLQIIHSDICGPITPLSLDGSKYFMIFVDQFTHYCVTY